MPLELQEIFPDQLTGKEKDSILAHAIDLHLIGSDDVESVGFDIAAGKKTHILNLLRLKEEESNVGVMYLFPLREKTHIEMTILIHEDYRGKKLTASAVAAVEKFVRSSFNLPVHLCASVHEHNPMRKELSALLMRHGYEYQPAMRVFAKKL